MILPPAQAAVFRAAVGCLSDFIGWDDSTGGWESGLSVFDRLTPGQRQAALLTMAQALLQRQVAAPPVTAVLAAAVAATYDALLGLIETEIQFEEGRTDLRRDVLAAVTETGYWQQIPESRSAAEAPTPSPTPWCTDMDQWAELVDALRDEILDDCDHALEDGLVDSAPSTAGAMKRMLGIDRDYFVTVPDDPSPARMQEIHEELIRLTRAGDGER
jgi:hypothetical protein